MKNRSTDSFKTKKSNTFIMINENDRESTRSTKYRPKTASLVLSASKGTPKSVVYDDNGRQFFRSRVRTSLDTKQ